MKLPFVRPHVEVAARALRYVIGELRRARIVPPEQAPFLLYMIGFPAPRLPILSPAKRPEFIPRPSVGDSPSLDADEKWLEAVNEDTRPFAAGDEVILTEVCIFHMRRYGRELTQERLRAPFLEIDEHDDSEEWFHLLPNSIWEGEIKAMDDDDAPTIVRRFSNTHVPEVPRFQLVMCPHWLQRLGWRCHPENRLVFLNSHDQMVARIVWWRDGGPVDIDDEVVWGEGHFLSVTPTGRAEIESYSGPLPILVSARRTYREAGAGPPKSKCASSRD